MGHESRSLRPGFSPQLGAFVDALGEVSVADHIAGRGSAAVRGLWHSLGEAYWGDKGFLAVHRRKAYAFLELAFKVGRSVTTGGFTGLFDDQTWEVAHRELEAARQERLDIAQGWCPMSDPGRAVIGGLTAPGITHLQLDVAGEGIRHDPGDRLAVFPENDPALVERTLRALRAGGDEPVRLDDRWRAALSARRDRPAGPHLLLRKLLTLGRIRPVTRAAAKALLAASQSERLARIVNARAEGDWELWDLLDLLSESGFQTWRLWRADPWDPASMAKIVPPDDPRLYSISSARRSGELTSEVLELLVADVHYQTVATDVSPAAARSGTASGFLHRVATGAAGTGTRAMAMGVVPSPRFRPVDNDEPMVMFAGGSGMAPFLAFLAARGRAAAPADTWLFLSTRGERHLALYREELRPAVEAGWLTFAGVLTVAGDPHSARSGIGGLIHEHAERLVGMMRGAADGRPAAAFYVCGAAGFARSVQAALEAVAGDEGTVLMRSLVGTGRYQQDVFTAHGPRPADTRQFDATDVVVHNDDDHGYWTVIDGGVYDLTELAHRHPGGMGILKENAGRDGTHAYRTIEHHLDAEIEAMLGIYRIGTLRRLSFPNQGYVAATDGGLRFVLHADVFRAWVRMLYRVVEVENAVKHDFGILDAVTVGGDRADELTRFKARLLLEAHQRFLSVYVVSLLGAGLDELWALTTGMAAPHEDSRALRRRLDAVEQGPEATAGDAWLTEAWDWLGSSRADAAGDDGLDRLRRLRPTLERLDLGFLSAVKGDLAAGVAAFERPPALPGAALMDSLRAIPLHAASLHRSLLAATDAASGVPARA